MDRAGGDLDDGYSNRGVWMMRKTLWIMAALFATFVTQIVTAQTTDVTFDVAGGTTQGVFTVTGNTFSLSLDGDKFNGLAFGSLAGLETLLDTGCTSTKWGACGWGIGEGFGNQALLGITGQSGNVYVLTGNGSNFWEAGQNFQPQSVPEPPVYALALLGVFLTRNRIRQGLLQAIRWVQ